MSEKEAKRTNGIAVIIPVYNRATVLLETLACVLAQTRLPDAIVVVDDGSTDETAALAREWLGRNASGLNWRILEREKSTAAKARIAGFSEVSHMEFVAFLDSDDHWSPDFLERSERALEEAPGAVGAMVDREYINALNEKPEHRGGEAFVADPIRWMFEHGAGVTSACLIRTSAYVESGGWSADRDTSEDMEFFTLLSLVGPWVYVPGTPTKFNIGSSMLRGEAHNISRDLSHREAQWAEDFVNIYRILQEKAPGRDWRRLRVLLARRWSLAGKQALKVGERKQARHFYGKSLRTNPYFFRTWRRWLSCCGFSASKCKKGEPRIREQ